MCQPKSVLTFPYQSTHNYQNQGNKLNGNFLIVTRNFVDVYVLNTKISVMFQQPVGMKKISENHAWGLLDHLFENKL